MAVGERRAFFDQPIQIRRIHVVKAELFNCVEPLLVSNDENNMRTFVRHDRLEILSNFRVFAGSSIELHVKHQKSFRNSCDRCKGGMNFNRQLATPGLTV